ncbi:MAG: hypothetical protein NPIRA04_30080 [Nitrospirales bacterium]|nr:MAG: hypothetical protein NPIRA04_30080 [Nitrospirales bacterium]
MLHYRSMHYGQATVIDLVGALVVITDHGKPVLKILPYSQEPSELLITLRTVS